MLATTARVPCAPWLGIHAVSRPPASLSSPQAAAAARVSIGAGATRWFSIVRVTMVSQPSNRAGSNWSASPKEAATLVCASGKIGSAAVAADMSTTGGSKS